MEFEPPPAHAGRSMSAADHGNTFSGEQRGELDKIVAGAVASFDRQAEEIRASARQSAWQRLRRFLQGRRGPYA